MKNSWEGEQLSKGGKTARGNPDIVCPRPFQVNILFLPTWVNTGTRIITITVPFHKKKPLKTRRVFFPSVRQVKFHSSLDFPLSVRRVQGRRLGHVFPNCAKNIFLNGWTEEKKNSDAILFSVEVISTRCKLKYQPFPRLNRTSVCYALLFSFKSLMLPNSFNAFGVVCVWGVCELNKCTNNEQYPILH